MISKSESAIIKGYGNVNPHLDEKHMYDTDNDNSLKQLKLYNINKYWQPYISGAYLSDSAMCTGMVLNFHGKKKKR